MADSNCYENKLRDRDVGTACGDEVEKELYIGGTKQLVMYQKKRRCLLIHFRSIRMADMTFLLSRVI